MNPLLKGDSYRPLILSGTSTCESRTMGAIVINKEKESKKNLIQVLTLGFLDMFQEGYNGYLFDAEILPDYIKEYLSQYDIPYLSGINGIDTIKDHDIIEIIPLRKIARVWFRADSNDNAIVVTNQCNCNCIMCPEPFTIRQNDVVSVEKIMNLLRLIEIHPQYLCITGGEPTLLKEKLFDILDVCRDRFPYTKFNLLTNARMFSYENYVKEFNMHKPQNMSIGIPIYGDNSEVHDAITDTNGSFIQSMKGIKNLIESGNQIELRIVVSKMNYNRLVELSTFIIKELPKVKRVSIMGLEMLGNAIINKEKVWIYYEEMKENLTDTAVNFIGHGIETYFYNFPLCFIDEKLWSITHKSISDYKVRYYNECEDCKVKAKCGGFFNSTINLKEIKVQPII